LLSKYDRDEDAFERDLSVGVEGENCILVGEIDNEGEFSRRAEGYNNIWCNSLGVEGTLFDFKWNLMELEIEGPNNVDRGFTRVGSLEGLKVDLKERRINFWEYFCFPIYTIKGMVMKIPLKYDLQLLLLTLKMRLIVILLLTLKMRLNVILLLDYLFFPKVT